MPNPIVMNFALPKREKTYKGVKMTLAYQYNASGYFVGTVEGHGLLPNNATYTSPEIEAGYAPRWNGEVWEQIEDHRGETGYVDSEPFTIKDYGPYPEGWNIDPPAPTEEELAEREKMEAETEASTILNTVMQRKLVQAESFTQAEFATFAKAGLFEEWSPGTEYVKGNRFVHSGIVYEAQQDVIAQEHQAPGSEGMLAIYRPISADPETGEEPDGSLENPIPYIDGMDVFNGKYYSHNGETYLCKQDMAPCVWPPDTEGLWQWELAG